VNIEEFRSYCLDKRGVDESFPFDSNALVFKVAGKMFALVDIESNPLRISLKCDPEFAQDLRSRYSCVNPGYHMNKTHWNTVILDGSVDPSEIRQWIDHSYALVIKGLTKASQNILLSKRE